jgi:hypothetical protein
VPEKRRGFENSPTAENRHLAEGRCRGWVRGHGEELKMSLRQERTNQGERGNSETLDCSRT